jgi:hypothetical protein
VRHRRLTFAVVLASALAARSAGGDILHLKTPSEVHTQGGSTLQLPPGYFLDEPTFEEKDAELRGLQDEHTRLNAENESLRKSARKSPWDWRIVSAAFAAGCAFVYFVK